MPDSETFQNVVDEAIQRLGGITKAVVASEASESTWHRWRRAGRILDAQVLFRIADKTGLPARQLAGYGVVNGTPTEPTEERRGRGRPRKGGVMPARYSVVGSHQATRAHADMPLAANG